MVQQRLRDVMRLCFGRLTRHGSKLMYLLRELEKKNAELISKLFAEQTYEKKTSDLRVMISELNSSLAKKDSELSSLACCVSLRTLLCMLRLLWDTPYGQLYDCPTSLKKRIRTWIPLS
ncbi:unnamed protein product [Prunus armeniaca]